MNFDFNKEKNELIDKERGISFYQVIEIISEKGVLLDINHPNPEKFPNQKMFVIEIDHYTYCIPYVINNETYFLKTIYANRNFLYLLKEDANE
ncbi:MAG: hypothetical protein CVV50_02860 [Spirochaetae bacterium HGW-Spirochaetae-6]|nr:MAG: hypothetical protein CVV50_02860 [Spirochaetae bacterium HGW-Spirochaetae-6]